MSFFSPNTLGFVARLLERETIIGLAVFGAIVATIGSFLLHHYERDSLAKKRLARLVLRIGYGITWLSVSLFIIVGFIGSPTNLNN
tara:strand:- start:322 stop:579 length:258 start_codon:yes stop_codon:yes gene_type:complete